jgi:hypothetical protein
MRSFETIFVSLSLSLLAFAAHGVNHARHHTNRALVPRDQFNGIRMTWYDITTGMYVHLLDPHRLCLIISLQNGLWWQLSTKRLRE